MKSTSTLSSFSALLININIILGTGLFINSGTLVQKASLYGALSYLCVGILILPIVMTIALLLKKNPQGWFYSFAADNISSFAGFMSAWIYFFAKQNSAVVGIYVFSAMTQEIFFNQPMLNNIIVTIFFIILFTFCNTHNMKTGLLFQKILMIGKGLLVGTIIIGGIIISGKLNFTPQPFVINDFVMTIPLVLFSLLGFESICSVSMHATKETQLWKIILISYAVTIGLYVTYQTIIYGFMQNNWQAITSFKATFAAIATILTSHIGGSATILQKSFYFCIALSALSGGYGILYTNQWNLYNLADKKIFAGHKYVIQKNNADMPFIASLIQCIICITYILISMERYFILQQLSAFGCSISYFLTGCALFQGTISLIEKAIGALAVISSIILLRACINNFILNGITALILFIGIITLGSLLFYIQKK